MKIALLPESPIEWIAARFGAVPRPILETMEAMMMARMIMAGVRLGVFEHLEREGARSPHELTSDLGLQHEPLSFLLRGLAALGYLREDRGTFANTSEASRFLVRGSSSSCADFVEFNYDQWEVFSGIEDTLRTGERLDLYGLAAAGAPPADATPAQRRLHDYLELHGGSHAMLERSTRGLRDLVRFQSAEIWWRLWLPSSIRSLLDLAGGHGGYSIAFCQHYSQLRATVLELGATAAVGRKIVEEEGFSDRVSYREGDLLERDFGEDHDVIFFFNIAHHLSDEQNRSVCARAWKALVPGGTFVILESFETAVTRFMPAAFGLFFQRTSGSRAYSTDAVTGWLREAGFDSVWTSPLLSTGGTSGLVVGTRPV